MADRALAMIEHKEKVKEHLKALLRYPGWPLQGQVRFRIWLDPSGDLKHLRILESSHPHLVEWIFEDLKAASPYPPFPRSMKARQVQYEYLVKYEPK
jgi:outer membrane biosynthesis protein TonB